MIPKLLIASIVPPHYRDCTVIRETNGKIPGSAEGEGSVIWRTVYRRLLGREADGKGADVDKRTERETWPTILATINKQGRNKDRRGGEKTYYDGLDVLIKIEKEKQRTPTRILFHTVALSITEI